ncbi:MAG TPA: (d)CMP kinase [Thermoflexales bacterium]|nr:(d)CMP kinase [Anaerolineae bacterium]HQV29483.1 (d)CMP kinase [Thermoflexales bacterium]HQX09257.1 (d)CMP kinase [Thermoflexales bacterium]HQY25436.1 (d)CMP kinase [Thermoflexales bacterium]HQZ54477.1 (d)CMP kinase [Thermoflexales bacterium]
MRIAIDGPAGSGKSTVGAALALKLGFLYFDTGVMYRAVTIAALRRGIPLDEEPMLNEISRKVVIEVRQPTEDDGRQSTVLLDGEDVTWELRAPAVDASVSIPSANRGVRAAMVEQQRRIAAPGNLVMVGRDIGTVVLPRAEVKIYLTATVEERALRRHAELLARGRPSDYDDVLASMRERDRLDSERTESPLRRAPDAIRIDSTGLTQEETLEQCLQAVRARQPDSEK